MPAGLDGNPDPVVTVARTSVIAVVADAVSEVAASHALVGIDGASGTGKSTFADEVAALLSEFGSVCVRASIDSFHRPRAERYRRGAASPEGYYSDSHDLTAFRRELLDPFRAGHGMFRTEMFDEPSDRPLNSEARPMPPAAVLVVDGLFLHRPQLFDYWHVGVFLVADGRREADWQRYLAHDLPDDAVARAEEVERRVAVARRHRYVEGQAIYERDSNPRDRATFVVDNDDLNAPRIVGGARRGDLPE